MAKISTADPRRRALDAIARHDDDYTREERTKHLDADPLRFPHRFENDPDDAALVALISALMAFGRVAIIGAKLEVLFGAEGLLTPSPAQLVRTATRASLHTRLASFRHRTFRGVDLADLLFAIGEQLRAGDGVLGPLEAAWKIRGDLRAALETWVLSLRSTAWPGGANRTQKHLLPDPAGAGASKRLLLFLRWIVRRDAPDLGLSRIPASALVIPLDVHIHRIGLNLGLTTRRAATWDTAEEITAALRTLDASDPVRFDFALCHLGIDGDCPSRRDEVRCDGCALRSGCMHWALNPRPRAGNVRAR